MRNSPHTSLYLSIPLLLSATSVLANSPHIVYTTEVVTALTTVCPSSTELVHGDHTYTITESTTFTITDWFVLSVLYTTLLCAFSLFSLSLSRRSEESRTDIYI
ncbi:hypothetical protein ACMFMG_003627 [Clarireedia jacksonii]